MASAAYLDLAQVPQTGNPIWDQGPYVIMVAGLAFACVQLWRGMRLDRQEQRRQDAAREERMIKEAEEREARFLAHDAKRDKEFLVRLEEERARAQDI